MRSSRCLDRPQCFAPARTSRTAHRDLPLHRSGLLLFLVRGSWALLAPARNRLRPAKRAAAQVALRAREEPPPAEVRLAAAGEATVGAVGKTLTSRGGAAASGGTVGSGGRGDGGSGG